MLENKKKCTKCGSDFPATNKYFYKKTKANNGLSPWCKNCTKEIDRDYRLKNSEKRSDQKKLYYEKNADKLKEYQVKYRTENPNKVKEYNYEYYQKHKEKQLVEHKVYYQQNCERIKANVKKYGDLNRKNITIYKNSWAKKKRLTDIKFAIGCRVSRAITRGLQFGKEGNSWRDLVDFTLDELIIRIESLFLPGMSWDNRSEWHIDHIRPVASFNFTTYHDIEFKQAWSLKNLQPLWAEDNLLKRDKWDPSQWQENGNVQMALIL